MKFKIIASILAVVLLSAGAYGGEDDKEKKTENPQDGSRGLAGFVQAGPTSQAAIQKGAMLDRRETKEDDLDSCIAQVTAIREVADASPLPRRGRPHSPFIYLRPSRAIHKCVPHRAGDGSVEGHRCGG